MTDKQFRELKQMMAEQAKTSHCPSCGACQHCGRGGQTIHYYPAVYPQGPWYQPYVWSGTQTVGYVEPITSSTLVMGGGS